MAGRRASRVRVVGEIDYGRTDRDRLEWQRYEAVINEALVGLAAGRHVRLRHPRASPDTVLESAS